MPELEAQGAVAIDVDIWNDTKVCPAALVQAAVRQTLTQLATPSSQLLARQIRIKGLREEAVKPLRSEAAAWSSYQALGLRPEELLRALGQLHVSASSGWPRNSCCR